MDRLELLVLPFVLLAILALSTELQRIAFSFAYRISQLFVIVVAVAAAIVTLSPSCLPTAVANWVTSAGYISEAQLADHGFWFWRGLMVVAVGVICTIVISHLRNLVDVNRHLKDIETLMGSVSRQIPETRDRASSQGVLRKAVDTMTEFFQR